MKRNRILKMVFAVAICEAIGGIGALITAPNISPWYGGLKRSALNPPDWIFPIVWTALFALLGVAIYLVWEKRAKNESARIALEVFVMQLVLNMLWSILFFVLHDPIAALWEIFALWLAVAWLVCRASLVSEVAGWLLLPYIFWVSFAVYLNYMVVMLNG